MRIRWPALAGIDEMAGLPKSGNRRRRRLMEQTERILNFPTGRATSSPDVFQDLLLPPSFQLWV